MITASRRAEPASQAPAAVEVVTADEIRASGAFNIWDLMRYRAGIDVIDGRSGDGNRAIVSVRGFAQEFVDKLLVLVDGRSVYTSLSGGAVWDQLPVQLQDIERIEIVRGPTAALYGSNAGLGVINIITKKPSAKGGVELGAAGGERSLRLLRAASEGGSDASAIRLSWTQKAIDGNPTTANTPGNDFLLSNKANARGFWKPDARSTLEMIAGGSWDSQGVLDTTNPEGRFHTDYEMARYTYEAEPGSNVEATLSRRDDVKKFDAEFPGLLSVREYQYDAELLQRLTWLDDRMRTVYGGSLRYAGVDSGGLFEGNPYQKNAIQRGFASQSWAVLPRLTLIGAASVEHSDTGGTQPAYNAAAVMPVAPAHTFRLSFGQAPTIPTFYDRSADQQASATVRLVGNPQIQPQRLRSYEVGYQGRYLDNHARLEANLFYMDVDHLARTLVQSFNFPVVTLSFANDDKAAARGAELKTSYDWAAGRSVYANYTYETISDAKGVVNVRQGTPAHSVNFGALAALVRGWAASVNVGYKDAHTLNSQATGLTQDIPAYWRLDARLSYSLPWDGVEVFVAGQNLTRPTHLEFPDGLVMPRVYYGGVTVRLGR